MKVTDITATSISLSWSVVGGSVARSEVVWRETDRGTESSSGSLTGTSYTIDQLESTTIYTVTVRASNAAGFMTDCQPIIVSTGECFNKVVRESYPLYPLIGKQSECSTTSSENNSNAGVIGGVIVAVAIIGTTALTVIVVIVLKSLRGSSPFLNKTKRHVTLSDSCFMLHFTSCN